MNVALLIIFAFLALSIYLGIRARRGQDMDLEQWTVGGRGFGTLFVFLLLAGEIYTTFTFLGGSGWAYGEGGPAFYILSYGCLAYVMSYWLLPAVWRYAKENRLHSQADFFASKYRSTGLGVVISLVTVLAMVPYLAVQFQGLGIIVSEASYGSISSTVAVVIGVVAVTVYVIVSGIHGSAWTSTVKDIMVLGIIVFLGLYLPFALYGGIGEMFQQVNAEKPGFLALPAEGLSVPWFISTVLLTALGFYMWPHTFGSAFSARSARVIRRNATYLPIYQLVMLFMVSATVLSKNVYKAFRPEVTEEQVVRLAKILVPLVALAGMVFALTSGLDLVLLLLLGYAFVTQLFPALGSLGDTNVGIVAMLANIIVLVVVSLATRPSTVAEEQRA